MYWEISDFKGLAKAHINLNPGSTTLITGVNSSGKSSLIQSLLMVAQSVYREGPIVLNGSLTRLGKPSELVRDDSSGKTMSLRIDLGTGFADEAENPLSHAFAEIQLSSNQEQSNLQVTRIDFDIKYLNGKQRNISFNSVHIKSQNISRIKSVIGEMDGLTALHLKQDLEIDGASKSGVYLILQGIVPQNIVILSNEKIISTRYSKSYKQIFDYENSRQANRRNIAMYDFRFKYVREVVELIESSFEDNPEPKERLFNESLIEDGFLNVVIDQILDGIGENGQELFQISMKQRAKKPYSVLEIDGTRSRRNAHFPGHGLVEKYYADLLFEEIGLISSVKKYLQNLGTNLNYIGPLRDEPRVLWSHWNELSRGLPVGSKGEYSAAVLSRFANRKIRYRKTLSSKVQEETLKDAINYWLNKLEISDGATSKSEGKLGVGIQVEIQGKGRDLTSVGVGVSQALPIIIGLLMTPRNGILIIEQPELHLHPNAQALLADFLITARPDAAVLIETHSEAIITRIRRRVAECILEPEQVDIVFIESTPQGGSGRSLKVKSYGDLSEWPKDFLSATQDDIRAIMKSNAERIRNKRERVVK